MKMSGLCWIAGMLIFLLSAGNSFADVDNKQLAHFVEYIMDRYDIQSQVSVAVNIPLDKQEPKEILKTEDDKLLAEVLTKASATAVREKINNKDNPVYPGDKKSDSNVVIARPRFGAGNTHAEEFVLDNIDPLVNSREGKMLLFYTYNSPCGDRCTKENGPKNILTKIKEILKWKTHAFVFSNPFDVSEDKRREALKQLMKSIGKHSIFRCYQHTNQEFRCIKCFKGTDIEGTDIEGTDIEKDCVEV